MNRLVANCVLICLPAVALCAVGTYFLMERIPRMEINQRSEATREYRATAVQMMEDPLLAEQWLARRKGWRQTGRLTDDSGARIPWGHVAVGDGELVWCGADSKMVAARVVPTSDADNGVAWLKVLVPAFMVGFVGISIAASSFFYRYSRERNDFLAATAHDLTTPLVAMRGLIGRDDAYAAALNERLLRIVANVGDFLRRGGKRSVRMEECDLGEAFDEAYRIFETDFAEAESGPVKAEGFGLRVLADRTMLVQTLWNLIGNELKYASAFGPITARAVREGGFAVVTIADDGPGMGKSELRRAFDRYYRARTVLKSGNGGFGIGLCNAREFARQMGGDLSVSSEGKGCAFTLKLRMAT